MGAIVFDHFVFDSWLTKKSDEILSKVDREKISNEDMLILILKALTNHFHHMDVEFREEFKKIDQRFGKIDQRFEEMEISIDQRFEEMEISIDERFEKMETKMNERFEKMGISMDGRFEKVWNFQKWQLGLLVTLFAGLYLKLFLG